MSALKYTIPEISAYSILSAAVETKNGYRFSFDATDPSRSYMVEETKQDDCPIFYQAMRVLGYNENDSDASEKMRDVFVFIDFSGIFDRKPVGKVLEAQKKAEYMFRPEGISIFFGKQEYRYIAFERSASMSRHSRLSFVREDIYKALRERMMLGMNIGQCQLSKLFAYNALLFTDGRRYRDDSLLSAEHIVVIDNPKSIVNVPYAHILSFCARNALSHTKYLIVHVYLFSHTLCSSRTLFTESELFLTGLIIEKPQQNHSAGARYFCIEYARSQKAS